MNPNDKFFLWALTAAMAGLPFGCDTIAIKGAQPRMQGMLYADDNEPCFGG